MQNMDRYIFWECNRFRLQFVTKVTICVTLVGGRVKKQLFCFKMRRVVGGGGGGPRPPPTKGLLAGDRLNALLTLDWYPHWDCIGKLVDCRLSSLKLAGVRMGIAGTQILGKELAGHPSLTLLDISNNGLTPHAARALLPILHAPGAVSRISCHSAQPF